VDSILPDRSRVYTIKGYTRQPDFYILYRQPRHYINLIIHPGDNFRVIADAASFEYTYMIEGSKDSRLVQKMVSRQANTLEKITTLSKEYESQSESPGFVRIKAKIDSTYEQVVREHRDFSRELIRENPYSLASLMALYQQLGRNIPVFDYKTDFNYYEMVDTSLSSLYPNSEAVKDLDRKVNELRNILRLETGAVAPAIDMPGMDGANRSLSSLRGRFVLLVFWASWSSQSCSEVAKLAPLYKSYAGSDLEFFLVSLDRTRESWVKSIESEKAAGIQVSDLKYWDSPVVQQYQITSLPVMYLLDREGRIVKKDFGADELPGIFSGIAGFHAGSPAQNRQNL
jgi:peroxiredoxin